MFFDGFRGFLLWTFLLDEYFEVVLWQFWFSHVALLWCFESFEMSTESELSEQWWLWISPVDVKYLWWAIVFFWFFLPALTLELEKWRNDSLSWSAWTFRHIFPKKGIRILDDFAAGKFYCWFWWIYDSGIKIFKIWRSIWSVCYFSKKIPFVKKTFQSNSNVWRPCRLYLIGQFVALIRRVTIVLR